MNNLIKKGLVVAVILLFIGLAFAPSINANISKPSLDSELVEITTEVCGLNGGEHTVSLSKEEAEEVEQLINDIERRLDGVETREEAEEIFNEAVVDLDKYGLLGGLSVEQVQKLVSGFNGNSRLTKLFDRFFRREVREQNDWENYFCLVFTHAIGALYGSLRFVLLVVALDYMGFDSTADALIDYFFSNPNPFWIRYIIVLLGWFGHYPEILSYFSIGLRGIKRERDWFVIIGFTGIKITMSGFPLNDCWYIGFAKAIL